MSESVIGTVRRELRRLFPEAKATAEQIQELLVNEILKREVIEGDKVKEAASRIKRATNRLIKSAAKNSPQSHTESSTMAEEQT